MSSRKAIMQLKEIRKLISGKELVLAAEWPRKYQVLISTILSAQTKDETTIRICKILFAKYPSMKSLAGGRLTSVEKMIRPINYHKTKARHILATAKMLSGKKIPADIAGLILLPGVGRKVGNVYLAEALKMDAIGVDTHVFRLSRKLGWSSGKTPHKVEKDLERLFPRKYWRDLNYVLVNFGRIYGRSRRVEDEMLNGLKS